VTDCLRLQIDVVLVPFVRPYNMPLVERYDDWAVNDQSHNDPHTAAFDHRLDAGSETLQLAKLEVGLAGVEK